MLRETLAPLIERLKGCTDKQERMALLDRENGAWEQLSALGEPFDFDREWVLKSLLFIGQADHLFRLNRGQLEEVLDTLIPVDVFYRQIGGIVGYHAMMLSLLTSEEHSSKKIEGNFLRPPGIAISNETAEVRRYTMEGLRALPQMAEMYPVGGAADRLRFCDPVTQVPLPAAKLPFCGRTLLEGLIRDVVAREYLYYKLFGEQLITPIAMMTSHEKDNHCQIVRLCEERAWFSRPKDSFRFFSQPLVPTMDALGRWCRSESGGFLMKPGGHGVLWKAAEDAGIFDWLGALGRGKLLVRQINNPIAGIDHSLLTFCGVGISEQKEFGFASCPRQTQSAEGMNVLIEKNDSEYCLTNIEYCDFKRFDIEDVPVNAESAYSRYPSNTNILFADIGAIREKIAVCPLPGMLLNFKKMSFFDALGNPLEGPVARLESMMQNIADHFVAPNLSLLTTFLTYQHRRKTISTAKREFQEGGSLLETPEGCYFELLQNAHELLTQGCRFILPDFYLAEDYLKKGPNVLFHYHPALGPLYEIIAQKLQGGSLAEGSELELEIAEIQVRNLSLKGSLRVVATHPVQDLEGRYSSRVGRCELIDVVIENEGIDRSAANCYWKREVTRKEVCSILIHEDGEFYAHGVVLKGNFQIEVPPRTRVTLLPTEGGGFTQLLNPIG